MHAATVRNLLQTEEPAHLGPQSRPGTLSASAIRDAVSSSLALDSRVSDSDPLVLALLLWWHDHLEASHAIAQRSETRDGSYVHALMHRREPDYGNAAYWWRRVGSHPLFVELSARVGACLQAGGHHALASRLISMGVWNPFAFTDACQRVEGRPATDAEVTLLRELQRLECAVVLDHLLGA